MDLNGDGKLDILSGCFADSELPGLRAGTFHVMWGKSLGHFTKPQRLNGKDGDALVIDRKDSDGKAGQQRRVCTRPISIDWDGDGKLDIVSGNLEGSFVWFKGHGKGKFEVESKFIETAEGRLDVGNRSDPSIVDWDGDGDLDILSGSSKGGVFLSINKGKGEMSPFISLVEASGKFDFKADEPLAPGINTRVCVDDVNGDGKWDVLVGDTLRVNDLANGDSVRTGYIWIYFGK